MPPIVVQNRKEEPPPESAPALSEEPVSSGISGKVREVNAENGFVVLDVGQKQGVKPGDALRVYRDSEEIAQIEIIKVSLNVSAADIKTKKAQIQPGDIVR